MLLRGVSISRRLRAGVVAVTTISVLVVFAGAYLLWLRHTVDTRQRDLVRQVIALATSPEAIPAQGIQPPSDSRTRLFRLNAAVVGARLVVTDKAGAILADSSDAGGIPSVDLDSLGKPDAKGVRAATTQIGALERTIVVAVPVPDLGVYLVAVQAVRDVGEAQLQVALLLGLAALVAVIVGWFAGGVFARRLSARIVHLGDAAEAIASGEWGRQVEEAGDDEIASLARSFNRMSQRVAEVYRSQQEFVGDVSHELRTPVTSIRGFAKAILDGKMTDEAAQMRAATVIATEAERLSSLTETLLALAELDSGRIRILREPVDVDSVRSALVDRHSAAAAEKQITLDVRDLGAGGVPRADTDRVLQIASQLVANAIAHTPPGGTVAVTALAEDGRWRLHVDDSGPGVPEPDRERVFERFVRLDESRKAGESGSGLGLAIVRRLAQLMYGYARIFESELGGARFELDLPLARD